jgi:Ca2+-binding RTX toxin-like protein
MGFSLNDLKMDIKVLADDVGTIITDQTAKVVSDPVGVLKTVLSDSQIALLGRQPDPVADLKNLVQYPVTIVESAALEVFNALPGHTPAPVFQEQTGAIDGGPGKVIAGNFGSGASLGDLSWLIYTENEQTNPAITAKWKRDQFVETTSGYDSSIYVDAANKQVAITFEGTVPNSAFSDWVLSKDGVADLQIGLGVIPPQMMEGYQQFKTMIAKVQNNFQGYGISLAGHSLGGGLAEMMSGMYYLDTGIALPTLAQESPGMLRQLKEYAEEQLLAGNTIHLPSGGTVKLTAGTLLARANEAKAITGTFQGQQFSNVINLLTEQDPVGQVNYSANPGLDGHVGVNIITPAVLTPRESLQDIDYSGLMGPDRLHLTTGKMPNDPLGLFPGLSNLNITRIDRHLPAQSEALWSGSSLGLYEPNGNIGVGAQLERTNGTPIQVWDGSQLSIPEVEIFGTNTGQDVQVANYVKDNQNALYLGSSGNDIVFGSNNGDMLIAGSGDTSIFGGNGDNYISGGSGKDFLYGGSGNDILYAGSGTSFLNGGGGNNLLIGGTGNDTFYWGGTGSDLMYNGQAGGNYDFIVAAGADGNSEIKWERNFTNIGSNRVDIQGAMASGSSLLFNFADEIRLEDMKWTQNGNDITMTDNGGNRTADVTFTNAVQSFAENNGKLNFQFTDGSLYVDDKKYNVVAGTGNLSAVDNSQYAGNFIISGNGNNTLNAGQGNDLLFGGVGNDVFNFNGNFGKDQIVSSKNGDTVKFNNVFNASEYSLQESGNDLVIDYQQAGTAAASSLTINNWYTSGNKVNQFAFADGNYTINNQHFVKIT